MKRIARIILSGFLVSGPALAVPPPAAQAPAPPAAPANADPTAMAAPMQLTPAASQAKAGTMVSEFLARYHYQPKPLDQVYSGRVFDHLMEDLDPEHESFTQADMASFSGARTTLAPAAGAGNLVPAFVIVNRFLNRTVEQYVYAQSLLGKGFDFTGNEQVAIERKNAPWPATENELHTFWRQRAENDWLRLKLAGQSDDAIRKTLSHRYESMVRRIRKTNADDAFQIIMTAFSESADPHTDYFSPKNASQFNSEMSLSLVGIGAYLRENDAYVQISELVPGAPADVSGKLHVGDRIVAVGQGDTGKMVDVVGDRSDDVVQLIRGKEGTTVRLELLADERKADAGPRTITLRRGKVAIEDQAAKSSVIDTTQAGQGQKIGVITVPSFYEDFDAKRSGDANYRSVTRDVQHILADFKKAHVSGVLLDLRNNGGGSLDEAATLVGLFSGGGPVVQVKDADGLVSINSAPEGAPVWTGPLGVLVNRTSASASEIFAAAIQDRKRGVILGETTFGKGTVQDLVDLDDATGHAGANELGELKMTIAQFYRVNGVSTQLVGVRPDIAFPDTGLEKDFGESTYTNPLPASSIASVPASTGNVQPPLLAQLDKGHGERAATSDRWKLWLDELKVSQKAADRTTLSLNFAQRKAERESDLATAKAFRARRQKLDQAAGIKKDDSDALTLDDGLDPSERALDTGKHDTAAAQAADAELQEAAQVVADESRLLGTNGVAEARQG